MHESQDRLRDFVTPAQLREAELAAVQGSEGPEVREVAGDTSGVVGRSLPVLCLDLAELAFPVLAIHYC